MTEDYTYDNGDKLEHVKIGGVTQKSYTYDAAGRTKTVVTGAGTTSLTYDFESRITRIDYPNSTYDTYSYNGLDTRISKVENGTSRTFMRDGTSPVAPVLTDGAATYTPGISERRSSTTTYLQHGLKNAEAQTGSGQTITASRAHDAFGNVLSSSGTWNGPFGYAGGFGYQEDASGLKLLGHRYYDSSIGRFLTRDPIKDGRNWYVYSFSCPTMYADPTGLIVVGIGGQVGGFVGAGGANIDFGLYVDTVTGNVAFGSGGAFAIGGGGGGGANGFISVGNGTLPAPGQIEHIQTVGLTGTAAYGGGVSGQFGGSRVLDIPNASWQPNFEGKLEFGVKGEVSVANEYGHEYQYGIFNIPDKIRGIAEDIKNWWREVEWFIRPGNDERRAILMY